MFGKDQVIFGLDWLENIMYTGLGQKKIGVPLQSHDVVWQEGVASTDSN